MSEAADVSLMIRGDTSSFLRPLIRPLLPKTQCLINDSLWPFPDESEGFKTWGDLVAHRTRKCQGLVRALLVEEGVSDARLIEPADTLAAALHLAHDWQDFFYSVVLPDRDIVVPREIADEHGVSFGLLREAILSDRINRLRCDCTPFTSPGLFVLLPNFKAMVRDLTARTRLLFDTSDDLPSQLTGPLQANIRRLVRAGRAMLDVIDKQEGDVLTHRPELGWLTSWRCALKRM